MVTVNSDYYPSGLRPWEGSRLGLDIEHLNTIQVPEARSSPPLTVARALREHCNIPFESFFLATHLGGGKFAYFTGPQPILEEDIRKIFRREKFLQFQSRTLSRESLSQTYEDDYGLDGGHPGRTSTPSSGPWQVEARGRKRPRRQGALRRDQEDDVPPVIGNTKRALVIGDSNEVLKFYDHRFRCIQQSACKEIAKAFVKVIAPKKQANNPYTKRDASAPDWWPKPSGPGEKGKVRHIEPDHQLKSERITVLKHILRMIIDPATRTPSVQKLGDITVAKLESAAMEALSNFFGDTSKPKNAKKKPILKELFKVAKMEEKYMRNEIDGTTQVPVTYDDMVMDYCFDEDEVDDEEEEAAATEIDRPRADSVTPSQVKMSPTRAVSLPLLPSLSPTSNAVHAMAAQFQAAPFLHELPLRSSQYGPPGIMPSDLQDHYAYPAAMQMHDMLAEPHAHPDTGRRSSLFPPPTEFTTGPSPSTMYHHPGVWSQSSSPQCTPTTTTSSTTTTTTPDTSSPLYAYAPAQRAGHHHHQQHGQHHHYHHHQQQQQQQQQQHQEHQQTVQGLPLPLPLPMSAGIPAQYQHQHQHQHQNQQHPTSAAYAAGGQYSQGYDQHHHHHYHSHHQVKSESMHLALQTHQA
ncbi:hypothetical protein N657DRAFT_656640 [Parathielavia appendiculata]|uniref:Subtelomeric hrmA-associated cluster protein AFUB-079030/YDR124W-like helical bundle domain-containing protein n=1 Tax=Parathielavia appendiculata TaxID=2587402 RepID=A0AAN6Z2P2_9PEZI|nr:hypothetical protein N657DRAFT_656640 [Parathielavia appendiculata]